MTKPDLSKPAKYLVRSKAPLLYLRKRRTWWLFSWYTNILTTACPNELLKKVYELEGRTLKTEADERI